MNRTGTDESGQSIESQVREAIAGQPAASIVSMWESDDIGIFAVIERPGPENEPLQTLYHIVREPSVDGGDHLEWKWLGPCPE